jgi:hypothetical protein
MTPVSMGDSGGDSQVGDDCPRRTLPTRDSARLSDFRGGGVSFEDWSPSDMEVASEACTAVVCSGRGEETLKPEKKDDCRGDDESTCGIVDDDGRCRI